jgi:HAD superfamily hydrolase (TIGR01662 family)
MTVKAIFFDIDGTLVDSNEQHVTAWDEAFQTAGAHFDRQTIHDQIGKGTDMLVPTLLPEADKAEQERLGTLQGEIFKRDYMDDVKPFPEARNLLERAHAAGHAVVFATSASQEEVSHYLDLLGARQIVAATTSADDVEHTKPAPDIFAAALKKIAPIDADEVIVVGDTPYDIEAAKRCGMKAVALRSGKFPDDRLRAAGAIALYVDVADLLLDFAQSPLASQSSEPQ